MTDRFEQLVQAIAGNDAFRVGALLSEDPDLVCSTGHRGANPDSPGPLLPPGGLGQADPGADLRRRTSSKRPLSARRSWWPSFSKRPREGAKAMAPDGFGVLGLAVYFGRVEDGAVASSGRGEPQHFLGQRFQGPAPPQRDGPPGRRPPPWSWPGCSWKTTPIPTWPRQGGGLPFMRWRPTGGEEIASLLVEHGASLTARSDDGRTPLEMARRKVTRPWRPSWADNGR